MLDSIHPCPGLATFPPWIVPPPPPPLQIDKCSTTKSPTIYQNTGTLYTYKTPESIRYSVPHWYIRYHMLTVIWTCRRFRVKNKVDAQPGTNMSYKRYKRICSQWTQLFIYLIEWLARLRLAVLCNSAISTGRKKKSSTLRYDARTEKIPAAILRYCTGLRKESTVYCTGTLQYVMFACLSLSSLMYVLYLSLPFSQTRERLQ